MARIPSISKPQINRILHAGLPIAFALGIVIVLGSLVIGILGEDVLEVYRILVLSAFGSLDDFGYVLFNATPLIFTGLAVAIGFKCGLFNIGCEGQLYAGGFVAAWVGFHFNLPAIILVPLCSDGGRRGMGCDCRDSQSEIWCPRGHQHNHDELYRDRVD